jgi:hypothetical protein
MKRGEIRLTNETLAVLKPYLIQRGVPLPPGAVQDEKGVSVCDADDSVLPSEAKILQRRPDGSVEWMLLDILVDLDGQESKSIFIEPKAAAQEEVPHQVTVSEKGKLVTLSNGLSEVVVSREGGSLIRQLTINGRTLIKEGMLVDLVVVDEGGATYRASHSGAYNVTITHQNRLRCEIRVDGKHAAPNNATFIDFALRFTLTADSPDLKLEHTFYCREDSLEKISIRSMRLVMPTAMDGGSKKLVRQFLHGRDYLCRNHELDDDIEIVASSVGDIDNYAQSFSGISTHHPCSGGNVFIRNIDSLKEDWSEYPFHMRPEGKTGFRGTLSTGGVRSLWPVIGWQDDAGTIVTTFEHFRQLHPKSIEISQNVITYSIWPEWSFPMVVVQGVSKSHIFWITGESRAMSVDDAMDVPGRWEFGYLEPVDISFDPAWPAFCEVLDCQHFLKFQPDKYPMLENMLEPVGGAGNPFRHSYDRQSAIGMLNFGCIVNPDNMAGLNNEDDCVVLEPLLHFLRTGHTYAWDYGKEAARHYMEVDFCESSTDERQNGGLIPHCGQHFMGNVYPSHQWAEGILTYYYMSGDERARNVVVKVGDNNVWWAYNKVDAMCDGREAGMPLVNLAAAYRLTRDEKYIKAAKHIIENFFLRLEKEYGEFKYPSPQNLRSRPQRLITGYGDWSSFAGLYRLWELTGDEAFRDLCVRLLDKAIQPGSFTLNDDRGMDFFSAWALGVMTNDMDGALKRVECAAPMLLRRGGHPLRRLHYLKEMDERGMIDDRFVGDNFRPEGSDTNMTWS